MEVVDTNKIISRNGRAIDTLVVLRRLDTTIVAILLPAGLVGGRDVFLAKVGMCDTNERS